MAKATASAIAAYLLELLRWNRRINLTGARSLRDLVEEHLDDSFALAKLVPAGSAVVDVGSGGGLPAVPFAILRPDANVCLVEPRAKRVAFLRTLARLGACLEVRHGRWQDLGSRRFGVATSRAVFPPAKWLEIGAKLVRPGGMVVVFASAPWQEPVLGGQLVHSLGYASGNRMTRWAGGYCFT